MLDNMRHFAKLAETAEAALAELSADKIAEMPPDEQFKYLLAEVKKAAGLREMAQACARDAASYVHPKLSATAVNVNEKRDHFDWTNEELRAIIEEGRADGGGAASRAAPIIEPVIDSGLDDIESLGGSGHYRNDEAGRNIVRLAKQVS
jgi:hypothetical protein